MSAGLSRSLVPATVAGRQAFPFHVSSDVAWGLAVGTALERYRTIAFGRGLEAVAS